MRNNLDDRDLFTKTFDDRAFHKATASGADGPDCLYLPTDGILDAVADSKTGAVLRGSAAGLVALAKAS